MKALRQLLADALATFTLPQKTGIEPGRSNKTPATRRRRTRNRLARQSRAFNRKRQKGKI